jgi:outer membrane protein TolC
MKKIIFVLLALSSFLFAEGKPLTLKDCIQHALQNNPDIKLAQKQLIAYKKGILGSYGGILPNVSVYSNAQRSTQGPSEYVWNNIIFKQGDTTTTYYNAGISYYQNIFDGGKWWNNIRLAKKLYENTSVEKNQTRQLIIANVTEKFYGVLKAQELLKVYQISLENSRNQLKKTQELFRIGQVAKRDLYKSQVNEGNDRLMVLQQETQLKATVAELNIALGNSPDMPLEVFEEEYIKPEMIPGEDVYQKCFQNNQALSSLQLQQQASLLRYKITKGDYYPSFYSTFSYSRGGYEIQRLTSEFKKWWNTSLTLTLSWSIFDGFQRKTASQQRYLDYKSYDDQITKKKMEIQNQAQNLLLSLETYQKMLEISELTLESAKEDFRLAQEMYRLNSATLLEVLMAQVELTRAQGNLISTKYDAKIAEVRLAFVMGTL